MNLLGPSALDFYFIMSKHCKNCDIVPLKCVYIYLVLDLKKNCIWINYQKYTLSVGTIYSNKSWPYYREWKILNYVFYATYDWLL